MVDAHTKAEYKGMKTYLTRDGKAGVAIKPDGDVVSLFSISKERNSMGKLIPFAVAHGGRKLDCYGGGLQNMYARFGAKAKGKVAFNAEYAPYLWRRQSEEFRNNAANRPDVVAMTLPKSLTSLIRQYDRDARVDLSKVRTYAEYDDMTRARDRALDGRSAALKAAFGTRG